MSNDLRTYGLGPSYGKLLRKELPWMGLGFLGVVGGLLGIAVGIAVGGAPVVIGSGIFGLLTWTVTWSRLIILGRRISRELREAGYPVFEAAPVWKARAVERWKLKNDLTVAALEKVGWSATLRAGEVGQAESAP